MNLHQSGHRPRHRRWRNLGRATGLLAIGVLLAPQGCWQALPIAPGPWSESEIALLRSLWIGSLEPLPPDPSNAVADDPRAAEMGHRLFFDTRLSGNGLVSCATCHQPARRFTDGLPKARAIGQSKRNTPSIIGSAYSPWLYHDGRKDSQWSQALSPLEDPAEQGGNRLAVAHLVAADSDYRRAYEALFGSLPELSDQVRFPIVGGAFSTSDVHAAWRGMSDADRHRIDVVFSNAGKTIAAYERKLLPGPARFDRYIQAVLDDDRAAQDALFTRNEVSGLRLFVGQGRCMECHNGPLLTNNEFHNTGILSAPGDVPDKGRIDGLRELRNDPFNCLGPFSDDPEHACAELEFARSGIELLGAMRTPSLRNLEGTEPFMHKGQLANLDQVLDQYNRAPLAMIGHNEAKPLHLSRWQLAQLEAFLRTLASPPGASEIWLNPPEGG